MRLVLMQPTYLPWIGYFDLMRRADLFVILDHVQFEPQSWQQRNYIKGQGGKLLLAVPVHQKFGQRIDEVEIDNRKPWAKKHLRSITQSSSKAPHWAELQPLIESTYGQTWERLSELTISLMDGLRQQLGIDTPLVRSSTLDIRSKRIEMILDICQHFGATEYLSPAGARVYLDSDQPFRERGLKLRFQDYEHPVYPQLHGEFISHLSVIDLIANVGPESLTVLSGAA